MSKSKLLKEAIADAKAVRETAIANAKIALEEAFTPRLQSILSRKLQAEMEGEEEEVELGEEYGAEDVEATDSSELGAGEGGTGSGTTGAEPEGEATYAHTELDPETDEETAAPGEEDENMPVAEGEEELDFEDELELDDEEDEDELDLEAIIRELEGEIEGEDEMHEEDENLDGVMDDPTGATMEEEDEKSAEIAELKARLAELEGEDSEEVHTEEEMEFDEEIDLDEILREMGYGDDEEVHTEEEHGEEEMHEEEEEAAHTAELEAELEEAYKTIKSLRSTINEVNLLNAKLLYTNKLFRGYNLTNEQKVKVVENLDRTSSVREVKLVYATLAESMKFTGTEKKASIKKSITEGLASKKSASTAPKKEIISESADTLANRFKKLAGIIE
jgi:hypothetical protein